MITVTCPHCKSIINLDESRSIGFCNYCGEKIYINDSSYYQSSIFTNSFNRSAYVPEEVLSAMDYVYKGVLYKAHEIFSELLRREPDNIYALLGEAFSSIGNQGTCYRKLKDRYNEISQEEKNLINRENSKFFSQLYCEFDDRERIEYMINQYPSSITVDLLTERTYENKNIDMTELLLMGCAPTKDIFNKYFHLAYSMNDIYSSYDAKYLKPSDLGKLIASGFDVNQKIIPLKKYSKNDSFAPPPTENVSVVDFFSKYFTANCDPSGQYVTSDFYRCYNHTYFENGKTRRAVTVTPQSYLDVINFSEIKNKYNKIPEYRCFMATKLFGSYDSKEVCVLRRFRDKWLYKSKYPLPFLNTYYKISPKLLREFEKSTAFQNFVKSFLQRLVEFLKSRNYDDSPYDDFI